MNPGLGFSFSSFWGPRSETPQALADRSLATFHRLQAIDPVFAAWYIGKDGRGVPLRLEAATLESEIAARSRGRRGYRLNVKTEQRGSGPQNFNLNMSMASIASNNINMGTDFGRVPNPSIVTYRIFRGALLAVADNFNVERAYAYPTKLTEFWPRRPNANPAFPIAWISYVTPRLTHLVTPPSTAIVERRPDGSLLMAATDETLDVDNPAHMSVARDIEAAVAPLNGRPWEPEI